MTAIKVISPKEHLFTRSSGKYKFKSIKTKLMVIIIVMLLISSAALTGIAVLISSNNLKTVEIEKLNAIGDGTSDKLWLVANMGKDIVTLLSTDKSIQGILLQTRDGTLTQEEQLDVSEYLAEMTDSVSNIFERINVVDTQGTVIASSYADNVGRNDLNRDIVSHQQRRAYIGEPYLGTDNTPRIPYGRPVYDDTGEQIGLVYIALNLQRIEKHVFARTGLSSDSTIFLIDQDGKILSSVNGDYTQFLTQKFDMSIFPDGENMVVAPGIYGEMEYIMITPVQGTNWLVVTAETVSAINAPIRNLAMTMIASSIIVIVIGILVTLLVTTELIRPILGLKENAEKLALGDIDIAITHTGVDELGQLADSFRHVIAGKKRRVDFVTRLAAGDVNFQIIAASDRDVENHALIQMKATLAAIVEELGKLTEQTAEGNLHYRTDAEQFQGVYRKVLDRLNQAFELIINPLQESMRLSTSYSSGDYSDRFDPDMKVKGDFIEFKEALNQIGINSSNAVCKIRSGVSEISTGSFESATKIEEIAKAVSTLAENSFHVSSLTDRNDTDIDQALEAMENISCAVGQVVERTIAVYEIVNQSSDLAHEGAKRAKLAEKSMKEIMEAFTKTSHDVSEMSEQIDEIGEILEIITGIAEQTGLIALNAAIEAACAGETGVAFAVVSDEVKALALESQNSAEHIGSIIGNLQKMSVEMMHSMEKAAGVIQSGNYTVNETITIFQQIDEMVSNVNRNMGEVTVVSEEQAAALEEIAASMASVRDMVQETAREATNSAAAAEEISALLNDLKDTSAQAAQLSKSIKELVDQFKID